MVSCKRVVKLAGLSVSFFFVQRFHAGDDIKILQENLGHYSAAFTLDVYRSVIREMQDRSAQNMQNYMINSLFL